MGAVCQATWEMCPLRARLSTASPNGAATRASDPVARGLRLPRGSAALCTRAKDFLHIDAVRLNEKAENKNEQVGFPSTQ